MNILVKFLYFLPMLAKYTKYYCCLNFAAFFGGASAIFIVKWLNCWKINIEKRNPRVEQNLNCLEIRENYQKSKKLGTIYKFLHTLRAYFCLIFTSFWKKLIFPGGRGLYSRIFTVVGRWTLKLSLGFYRTVFGKKSL